MQTDNKDSIIITPTTKEDVDTVFWLFEQAMALQGKNGYKVWDTIDRKGIEKDIENRRQYKIVSGKDILCIFSIQFSDPFIWRERDQKDAIYLHRIVVHPAFKGQKLFAKVLDFAIQLAQASNLRFVRMDTWAENKKIIDYYQSFGFAFVENYKTADTPELPLQNRNLNMALLEMPLKNDSFMLNRFPG